MDKLMRNAPSIIVGVVLLLQTPRVSDFGERIGVWLPFAVIFALFLSFSTFTLSYFQGRTRSYVITANKDTDTRAYNAQKKMQSLYSEVNFTATLWLIIFVLIEGSLNLAETMSHLKESVGQFSWEWFGAIVYGIFPTLAAYGMGGLQALIDKMPHGAGVASQLENVFNAYMRRIANSLDANSHNANASDLHNSHNAKTKNRNADAYPKPCPHCGEPQAGAGQYSAHIRWQHADKKSTAPVGFNTQPVSKDSSKAEGKK